MIELKISLELTKNGIQKSVYAKAGEINSRKLIITLTESGKIFELEGLTARVFFENGTYSDRIKRINNAFEFILPSELLEVEGLRICELKITRNDTIIYSPMFEVIVEKSLGNEGSEVEIGERIQYQEVITDKTPEKTTQMSDGDSFVVHDSTDGAVRRFLWQRFWAQHGLNGLHTIAMVGGLREALDSKASMETVVGLSKSLDTVNSNLNSKIDTSFSILDKKIDSSFALRDESIVKLQEAKHTHSNKSVIDKFSEAEGKLLYNGKPIESEGGSGSGLPSVSEEDNGKLLMVENGAWAAVAVPSAEEAVF